MSKVYLRKGDYPTLTYVTVGPVELAFSYETIVGFATAHDGWVVSENVWSRTTGKHLSSIPRGQKEQRVPHADFTTRLAAVLDGLPLDEARGHRS